MSQFVTQKIGSQYMPESAISAKAVVNLVAGTATKLDFTNLIGSGAIQNIQAVFVDNSANSTSLTLTTAAGQNLIIPPASQGIFPVILANGSPTVTVAGSGTATLLFLNVPMPFGSWSISGAPALVVTNGNLQVTDTALDATIANGGVVYTAPAGSLISGSTTSPATAASTQLFPAYARRYLAVQAPVADDLWLNINGGAASIGGLDCVRVPAGTFYEFRAFVSQSAIFYYTAATSTEFAAFQA